MKIFIAREGVEIGEFSQSELEPLARQGELLSSDHYWREGMQNWRRLDELLGHNVWRAARRPASAGEETPAPANSPADSIPAELLEAPEPFRRPRGSFFPIPPQLRLPLLAAVAVIVLLFVTYMAVSARSDRAAREAALFLSAPEEPRPSADAVRDKAANDLRAKIERLPARPGAPLHTFYYGISVNMRKSVLPRVPWTALIRGNEDTVDPETQETLTHTNFILMTEYLDGEWTFRHYRATAQDMQKKQTTEINQDAGEPTPPSIVGMLGLKMPP